MNHPRYKNVAGVALAGGRKDNFFFCLLEYFENEKRWFLKSLLQVADEEEASRANFDGNDAIREWIDRYAISDLVVDFPLSRPMCDSCTLACPGLYRCPQPSVLDARRRIETLLHEDGARNASHPKGYEQDRNDDDLVDPDRSVMDKQSDQHLLSRSFKRRLKKGFLPYWNRNIDFYIWRNYYDQMLELFNISYDSFGQTSLMLTMRFAYLKRHFPATLRLYEANTYLALLELVKAKVITVRHVKALFDINNEADARYEIIRAIESGLNIFIYQNDIELLTHKERAFESFILALSGRARFMNQYRELPDWVGSDKSNIIIPKF